MSNPSIFEKISRGKLGKPLLKIRGSHHWNWRGGIQTRYKKETSRIDHKLWRLEIYKNANYKCQICDKEKTLDAHHIKDSLEYPKFRFNINNGMALCKKCHRIVHHIINRINKRRKLLCLT